MLYGADLARAAARQAGWVAVVEGYTDVIAAHQAGLENVVGTLGTALGEDHIGGLRRLADRVVLVFDGDEAGMSAADRSLELFLGHEIDLRVLTLPAGLDPCDFLLQRGGAAFRDLAEKATDPLTYLLDRAQTRFDFNSDEGARRAAEGVLGILNSVPINHRLGIEVKIDKALDRLSFRLRVPKATLIRMRQQLQKQSQKQSARRVANAAQEAAAIAAAPPSADAADRPSGAPPAAPIRLDELDRTDLDLMQVALNEPAAIEWLAARIAPSCLRDASLRAILQACYDLQAEGQPAVYEGLMGRLEDPALRGLATDLVASTALSMPEPAPLSEGVRPAPWRDRLERLLTVLEVRERHARLEDLKRALEASDRHADPDAYRAIELEYRRLLTSGRTRKA